MATDAPIAEECNPKWIWPPAFAANEQWPVTTTIDSTGDVERLSCGCCRHGDCPVCIDEGSGGGCDIDCGDCHPPYAYVTWDKAEQDVRRFMCSCPRRAYPLTGAGHRAICGKCECYLYSLEEEKPGPVT